MKQADEFQDFPPATGDQADGWNGSDELTDDTPIYWLSWPDPDKDGVYEPVKLKELTWGIDRKTIRWNEERRRWEGGYPY